MAINGNLGFASLDLTKVDSIYQLNVSGVSDLKEILLPSENSSSVVESLKLGLETQLHQSPYDLYYVNGTVRSGVSLYNAGQVTFSDIDSLADLTIVDSIASFQKLEFVDTLEVKEVSKRPGHMLVEFEKSLDVSWAVFSNLSYDVAVAAIGGPLIFAGLAISLEIIIEGCVGPVGDFRFINSVSGNMTVREMSQNPQLTFSGLQTIEDTLTVANNSNVTLGFEHLANISTIFMANTTLTTIPGNRHNLNAANKIYLNGQIDT